ncbi:MAG: ABC transporter ATP-binding protein [Pseudomonadota bacterium]|nr:ABC transporter ATP-binding protein [Pseudomonadota bacterium]
MIEVKNLWKRYGDNVILENVNVTVNDGEFITLVGTSGCGKSTFLKLLLGSETPSQGGLFIDEKPLIAEPNPERGIVFQQYSVFPHLRVLDNVIMAASFRQSHFTGRLFSTRKKLAEDEAAELLHQVGLGHALKQYPHELSGGMRQRLAIAQALISKPRVLLLDEPFGALDPGIRKDMHQLLLSLWQKHQLTVFMVTHDLKEGFYLGTRLWVFDKVRHDPQSPHAFGARITYDIPVGRTEQTLFNQIEEQISPIYQPDLTADTSNS